MLLGRTRCSRPASNRLITDAPSAGSQSQLRANALSFFNPVLHDTIAALTTPREVKEHRCNSIRTSVIVDDRLAADTMEQIPRKGCHLYVQRYPFELATVVARLMWKIGDGVLPEDGVRS
jgi:hypothetical protein